TCGGSPMTFDHPWALLLVLAAAGWAAWEWRSSSRRGGLLLKTATFVAIALALAGPVITVYQSKVAVAMLADTSASTSAPDLQKESGLADQMERARGRNWMRVIPFARATRMAAVDERHPGDRKSTRLNSSHVAISYAVFCLKKKTKTNTRS